ncbi:MAG: hypothetical protein ACRELY_27505 [Polyangiaceae bacterium]
MLRARMASSEDRRGAPRAPANDSIDELLGGLPADPMLPRKRARSIEEVKAAEAPASHHRREGDNVVVSEGTDPRERVREDADRERRESSTFGTAFLQARLTREKIVFGVVMMLAVLGIYAFVRHELHPEVQTQVAPSTTAQSVQNTPNSPTPITAADLPPPPATAVTASTPSAEVAPHPTAKASHASDTRANKPPPPPPAASASAGRTDVSRSL